MRYFYLIVISILIALLQVSVFSPYVDTINITLLSLVFIYIVFSQRYALVFALTAGIVIDWFVMLPFFSITFVLLVTLAVLYFFSTNVFTNFSVYSSIIIMAILTVTYVALLILVEYAFHLIGVMPYPIPVSSSVFANLGMQVLYHCVSIAVLFILMKKISKRLETVFLSKK